MEPVATDLDGQDIAPEAYEYRIIDSDFHAHIPTEKLYEYVQDDYVLQKLEEHGPPPFGSNQMSVSYSKAKKTTQVHDRVHGTAVTGPEIREVCDDLAIDVPIVQPGTDLELTRSNYPTVTNELLRAYNDFVAAEVISVSDDVYATLLLPEWDVDLALAELDRHGDREGFVAAENWLTTHELWGDIQYDPVFAKLDDLDLNLVLHVTGGNNIGPNFQRESMRTITEYFVGELGSALLLNVINMVMTGVFDKFPDLQVSVQEAGTNWIPYVAYRLDEIYQSYPQDVGLAERLHENGQTSLERLPSEYIFDNFYTATQPTAFANVPRQDHVEGLLKSCRAEDTFMYTSDWPHLTLDPAEWVFDYDCIDEEMRHAILHGNSEEFLRIDA